MITAETITNDQIRELSRDVVNDATAKSFEIDAACNLCGIALDDGRLPFRVIREARARCAELLNARAVPPMCSVPEAQERGGGAVTRANTGTARVSRRPTVNAVLDAMHAMLADTAKHPPESWRAMKLHLIDALPGARCADTREMLVNLAADCDGWAARAELAANPAGAFYTARATPGATTMPPVVDNAGWLRADAEIDADDNTDMTGDEGRWGANE